MRQPLGRGGMGEVWLAQDERLNEPVALKFLPPEVRADAGALDDLRRETARSHKLTHPNIVRIHDFQQPPGEAAFISMEYVDGPTLAGLRVAQPSRVLSWDYLRPLVQQLCAALDYAHGEHVVHRDLKPSNLMLDSRGRLKLADFGIAAVVSDSVSRISARPTSGTLAYMSPQQLAGKRASVTDDIYALGATLYELLTSKPPFYTGDLTHQVLHEAPEPLDERLAALGIENAVPGDVSALIMACLGKDPAVRPQSAQAVAEWIGLEVAERVSTGGLAEAVFVQQQNETEAVRQTWSPGKVALVAGSIIAVLLLATVAAWLYAKHHNVAMTALPAQDAALVQNKSAGTFELAQHSAVPFTGTLPGTIWLVKDSSGDRYCFEFLADGRLSYEAGRGVRSNGRWQADGQQVDLNINEGYASLTGTISGNKIQGQGHSRNGQTWTWEAIPNPGPAKTP